jgi:hypothetical protein
MDILYLVDRLEELINDGWHIPLTSNIVIDEEEFLDIVDQMRITIPDEVKQSKRIMQEKDRLISQAEEESERILTLAREQNQSLVSDHEVLKAAEAQRQAIIEEGRNEVRELRKGTDVYVIDTLSQLEEQLSGLLRTVRNGIAAMQAQIGEETSTETSSEEEEEEEEQEEQMVAEEALSPEIEETPATAQPESERQD